MTVRINRMKRFLLFALCMSTHVAALSPARAQAAPFLVCIDPGHPSETSDGANEHGLSENKLNWQVALRFAKRLRALHIPYVMTKTSINQRVTNRRRAEIANAADAAICIRLHCDTGSGRGFTWYYPDRAARKGNVVGPPLEVQRASRQAAYALNEAMKPVLRGSLKSNPVKTDAATGVGSRQGGVLTGSIYARVPIVLIEMCFINQKSDARFIASSEGQEKMARALAAGIARWKKANTR